jgi:hypothetical protein
MFDLNTSSEFNLTFPECFTRLNFYLDLVALTDLYYWSSKLHKISNFCLKKRSFASGDLKIRRTSDALKWALLASQIFPFQKSLLWHTPKIYWLGNFEHGELTKNS